MFPLTEPDEINKHFAMFSEIWNVLNDPLNDQECEEMSNLLRMADNNFKRKKLLLPGRDPGDIRDELPDRKEQCQVRHALKLLELLAMDLSDDFNSNCKEKLGTIFRNHKLNGIMTCLYKSLTTDKILPTENLLVGVLRSSYFYAKTNKQLREEISNLSMQLENAQNRNNIATDDGAGPGEAEYDNDGAGPGEAAEETTVKNPLLTETLLRNLKDKITNIIANIVLTPSALSGDVFAICAFNHVFRGSDSPNMAVAQEMYIDFREHLSNFYQTLCEIGDDELSDEDLEIKQDVEDVLHTMYPETYYQQLEHYTSTTDATLREQYDNQYVLYLAKNEELAIRFATKQGKANFIRKIGIGHIPEQYVSDDNPQFFYNSEGATPKTYSQNSNTCYFPSYRVNREGDEPGFDNGLAVNFVDRDRLIKFLETLNIDLLHSKWTDEEEMTDLVYSDYGLKTNDDEDIRICRIYDREDREVSAYFSSEDHLWALGNYFKITRPKESGGTSTITTGNHFLERGNAEDEGNIDDDGDAAAAGGDTHTAEPSAPAAAASAPLAEASAPTVTPFHLALLMEAPDNQPHKPKTAPDQMEVGSAAASAPAAAPENEHSFFKQPAARSANNQPQILRPRSSSAPD